MMSFMSGISSFPSVQHEPLNVDRAWGEITRNFSRTTNDDAARATLRMCLANKPNIKHCIDVVPIAITRVLIEECSRLNYAFFFLNRRSEKLRLESLFIALATGAWGADQAKVLYPKIANGEINPESIDVKAAQGRARQDAASVGQVLSILRNRNIPYEWLLFEEIYADRQSKENAGRLLLSLMGVDESTCREKLERFSLDEGQKSQNILDYIPGASDLSKILDKLSIE